MRNLFLFVSLTFAVLNHAQTSTPKGMAKVKVLVISNKNIPIEYQEVSFTGQKSKKTYSGISPKNGKFQLFVPIGDIYLVQYRSIASNEDYAKVEIQNIEGAEVECELKITPGTNFTLDNVFFDTGKSSLKTESFKELDELVLFMTQKKSAIIEISGHTDNVGNQEANLKLSQDRAHAVRNYLIKKGIAAIRVTAKGHGDTLPVADNSSEAGRKQNRRTEVLILKQ